MSKSGGKRVVREKSGTEALEECRAAYWKALKPKCKDAIERDEINLLMSEHLGYFTRNLDGPTAKRRWSKDQAIMLQNCRVLALLTELYAVRTGKGESPVKVTAESFKSAYRDVKKYCDTWSGIIRGLDAYCG